MSPRSKRTGSHTTPTPTTKRTIPAGVWVRFAILGALWLYLCGLLLVRSAHGLTVRTLFIMVASAIVIFVPMYKKYIRNGKHS